VLLIVGWLAARFAKVLTLRLVTLLDGAIQRLFQRRGATAPPSALASGRVVGELVFWVVMLFFLTAAMHILGVETFTAWMHRVLGYLPTLVVGALIILAGFLVSSLARDIVIAAAPLETASRRLLGRGAQAIILVTAIVIGADQIGINITFVVIITSVILAALLGGVALALSLGARTYVANLIGARYLRETYRVGQRVRIGEQEGRVLEFSATAIVLETTAGRMNIPGKVFNELPSVLLVGNSADEHR
jgi:small-conductance mechanosensitive channel